jgi:enoyl-CoA hydratase/carnithine racemase
VPDQELDAEAASLTTRLAGMSQSALGLTKRLFYQLDGLSLEEGVALGARVNAVARGTPDFRNAVRDFLKK